MSAESAEWLAGSWVVIGSGRSRCWWGRSVDVHVCADERGAVSVWMVAVGGPEPWPGLSALRTPDGSPLRVRRVPVRDGNAAMRLAWGLMDAACEAGYPCALWFAGGLVAEWGAADIESMSTGRE